MDLSELMQDEQFRSNWQHVWAKLEPFFIKKMMTYASAHKGQHEKVGQFAEFMAEVIEDFKTLDVEFKNVVNKRPRLHNKEFK
jgi:hypothetical protein